MSKLLKRLHDRQVPHGIETTILKKMPLVFVAGTAVVGFFSILVRVLPADAQVLDAAKRIATTDILVIATLATFWTAVLTVSIGCVIVYLMKGPAYIADAYPLSDSPRPRPRSAQRPR